MPNNTRIDLAAVSLIVICLITGSAISLAEDAPPPQKTTTQADEKKNNTPSQPLPPVKLFIPTEKIEADSTVSLPVDI